LRHNKDGSGDLTAPLFKKQTSRQQHPQHGESKAPDHTCKAATKRNEERPEREEVCFQYNGVVLK